MSEAYSGLKALRHLDVIQSVRSGVPARPVHVQIILSDLCNQACNFCSYRDPSYSSSQLFYEIKPSGYGLRRDTDNPERNYNPNRQIAYGKALEILDDCCSMGVQAVQFTGGGEPTAHPKWKQLIADARDRGLSVGMVSNGVNISKQGGGIKAAEMCEWIRISIDASSKETYCKVRNVGSDHFDAAWEAVRQLARTQVVVGVGFVVTPENWHELYDAALLAKSAGANNIRIGAQFSEQDEHLFDGFADKAAELARQAEALSDENFTVFNRFSEKLDDLKLKQPDYDLCGYQFFTTYIGADLNVYRCCVQAYNERGIVGSLKTQRFKELWESKERSDKMKQFQASDCDRCQFNGINRVLEYALKSDEPLHSEFV